MNLSALRCTYITGLCFFISFIATAQINFQQTYVPLAADSAAIKKKILTAETRLTEDLKTLNKFQSKDVKAEIEKVYRDRLNSVKSDFSSQNFYSDPGINNYFKNILHEILKANNKAADTAVFRLFVSRFIIPNAYCVGEGTLVYNIGMLRWQQNESQIAAIICHELAHYYLNHSNDRIEKSITTLYSEEVQKELKNISKAEYNKNKRAVELMKGIAIDFSKHSRYGEEAADSLGFVFLKNTRYDEREMKTMLAILDSIDSEKYQQPVKVAEVFNFKEFPFKEHWIKQEQMMLGFGQQTKDAKEEALDDSLKTHPDCKKRVALIEKQLSGTTTGKKLFIQPKEAFDNYVILSDFEVIESSFFFENYARCIYHALKLVNKYPDNQYLHAQVGLCLDKVYEAQKNHEMGRYVTTPSKSFKDDYNDLLNLLHRMRLNEIPQVGYHYMHDHFNKSIAEENALYAFARLCKLNGSVEMYVSLKNEYLSKYPKGKYYTTIKNL